MPINEHPGDPFRQPLITDEGIGVGLAKTLNRADIDRIAADHDLQSAHVWALLDVESSGSGFLEDGRLKILYEAHIFDRSTDGQHRKAEPTLSTARWDRTLYWGGAAEHMRLARAMRLDRDAALRSTSYGAAQIMGFNHELCGYATVDEMVFAFADSEAAQIGAMIKFIAAQKLDDALRALDWHAVASGYNGPGYRANSYHHKLALAFASHSGRPMAFGHSGAAVHALQAALAAAGHSPGQIDGALGPRTADALLKYQAAARLPYPEMEV